MLTKLEAYSSWSDAPTLPLLDSGREETDVIQIRDISGLDPVKATVNTSPFGSVDGSAFTGASVPPRNIVITFHHNPDWINWSYESIRKLLYSYFMPKLEVRLVFYNDDADPVEIYGYVESCAANAFSKDPETQVSIICPDPYFVDVNPTVVNGISNNGSSPASVQYQGSIATGFNVEVVRNADPAPSYVGVQVGNSALSYFTVLASAVDSTKKFVMNSLIGQKYVRSISLSTGLITNLYPYLQSGSVWPILEPGSNDFSVITDQVGKQDWELTYYAKYGGL